jgi:polyhydroxyalkanoate synthesis regulator phasin
MVDLIKKTLLAGVGLAFMTKEKAEEAAKVIVKETKIAEGEGKKFISDLIKKSEEAKAGVEKLVNNAVNTTMAKLDLPSKAEIKRLEARIRELEDGAKPAKAGHK